MVKATDGFLRRFQRSSGATALFYFAGHGAQVNDKNYLFGTNAAPDLAQEALLLTRDERSVLFLEDAISIEQDITSKFGDVFDGALILVIDGCRDNPLINDLQGLPGVRSASGPRAEGVANGVVIVYSTTKGAPARDGGVTTSLYPKALIKSLRANTSANTILDEAATIVSRSTKRTTYEQVPSREGSFDEPPPRCIWGCVSLAPEIAADALSQNTSSRLTLMAPISLQTRGHSGGASRMPAVKVSQASAPRATDPSRNLNTGSKSSPYPIRTVYERLVDPARPASPGSTAMRFDVFWCTGDSLDNSRQIVASEIASTLATLGKVAPEVNGSFVGSVRVRVLPPDINAKPGYQVRANVLQYEADDPKEVAWAAALRGVFTVPVEMQANTQKTPGYMSVFVCDPVDPRERQARVYFQIAAESQADFAYHMIQLANGKLGGLSIAPQLDRKFGQSPNKTEVRYYHPEDEVKARSLADLLTAELNQAVNVKLMGGYEEAMKSHAQIEVWLGKDTRAPEIVH